MVKYTKAYLQKLETLFQATGYKLRYEKGTFKTGFCILKDQGVVVVNNYYPLEGKVNSIIEVLTQLDIDLTNMDEKNQKLLNQIRASKPTAVLTDDELVEMPESEPTANEA